MFEAAQGASKRPICFFYKNSTRKKFFFILPFSGFLLKPIYVPKEDVDNFIL